ncbi:MAG: glycosyltransferase family 2 protein [Candidatus Omnitrophota bacterium]
MKKCSLMFLIMLGIWSLLISHFNPYLLRYISFQSNLIAKDSIIGFVLLIDLFWLYGLYHIIVSLFSRIFIKRYTPPINLTNTTPKVALLYLSMNDFKEEAALSCINQDYPNFDVFVLDDSTDEVVKTKIDKFIEGLSKKLLIFRRPDRKAYKAGNLNYALNKIYKNYEYFVVCDADGILPRDFLEKLMPYFSLDESVGFVQANQRSNPKQTSVFAKNFSFITDIHWKYYVPAREKFGFLMFYGHGAVIKTSVWKEAGGFPETVTEDLAFSSIIREKGYKGIFVPDVICYEDFPENYPRFRRRNERWIKGTTEYLLRWYPRLLFSKDVSWPEKLDILLASGNLLLAFPFLIYLFIVGITLPFSLSYFDLHIPLSMKIFPSIRFYSSWEWDFYLAMIIAATAQLLPISFEFIKTPLKMFRYLANFTFISLSTVLASFYNILSYLITGTSFFPVTGSKGLQLEPNIIFFTEVTASLILGYIAIYTTNIWLLTIALALGLDPLFYKFKWQNAILYGLTYMPFIANILIIVTIGFYVL